jgi:hypothetical protein
MLHREAAGPVDNARTGGDDPQISVDDDARGDGAPAGSGVGELGSSVRLPPFTANEATTLALLPFTSSVLPSGDRRASTAPAPAEPNGVLPSSTSEPGG